MENKTIIRKEENNLRYFEGSVWELFKLPIHDLSSLNNTFNEMKKRLDDHFIRFPQDKDVLDIGIVDASSDYLNVDYKEGENWIRISIKSKKWWATYL